jgi:hypothetical protein
MWSALELRHVDLGDRRLNRRLVKLLDDLLNAPEASVPQASSDWAATKAAYRFWDNPRVDPDDIRAAHRDSALERLPAHHAATVLAIQDSTSFDFTDHPAATGLGYLAHGKRFGLWLHSTLAVVTRRHVVPPTRRHVVPAGKAAPASSSTRPAVRR